MTLQKCRVVQVGLDAGMFVCVGSVCLSGQHGWIVWKLEFWIFWNYADASLNIHRKSLTREIFWGNVPTEGRVSFIWVSRVQIFCKPSVCKSCQTRVEFFLKNYSIEYFLDLVDRKNRSYGLVCIFQIFFKNSFDKELAKSWFGWIEFFDDLIWFSQIQSHLVMIAARECRTWLKVILRCKEIQ